MPKIDISKFSPEDILYLQNQLAKRAKQLSKAKKSIPKPKRVIPDDVDDIGIHLPWLRKQKQLLRNLTVISNKRNKKNRKIKRSNKALTEARIKSADEYQRRRNDALTTWISQRWRETLRDTCQTVLKEKLREQIRF